jgi:hypothetical protein
MYGRRRNNVSTIPPDVDARSNAGPVCDMFCVCRISVEKVPATTPRSGDKTSMMFFVNWAGFSSMFGVDVDNNKSRDPSSDDSNVRIRRFLPPMSQ